MSDAQEELKLGVVGSRNYKYDIAHHLYAFMDKYGRFQFISGGVQGVDTDAERWANGFKLPVRLYLPEWDKYGKSAGVIRNRWIVQQSDVIMAFWDGKSRGTLSGIRMCAEYKKPLILIVNNDVLSFGDYTI